MLNFIEKLIETQVVRKINKMNLITSAINKENTPIYILKPTNLSHDEILPSDWLITCLVFFSGLAYQNRLISAHQNKVKQRKYMLFTGFGQSVLRKT
jgi:hypothetical protein